MLLQQPSRSLSLFTLRGRNKWTKNKALFYFTWLWSWNEKKPYNNSPDTLPSLDLDPNDCTDSLTSSICNLDYIFDDPEMKVEKLQYSHPNKCHRHNNMKLASQKKCHESLDGVCHGNSSLKARNTSSSFAASWSQKQWFFSRRTFSLQQTSWTYLQWEPKPWGKNGGH